MSWRALCTLDDMAIPMRLTVLLALMAPLVASAQSKTAPPGTVEHDDALRRAQVWFEPPVPTEDAPLRDNPPGDDSFAHNEEVSCWFKPDFTSGSTPKFDCQRADGRKIKVKYGHANAEIYAEVAASRLLSALGFPADRMYVVGRVRCYGCPADPFAGLQCLTRDAATCTVSMRHLPYGGSSFSDVEISEQGRVFLANRLTKLSTRQVHELFDAARVSRSPQEQATNKQASAWASVFMDKVRMIADRPQCPIP